MFLIQLSWILIFKPFLYANGNATEVLIEHGLQKAKTSFAVYLTESPEMRLYDSWICAGAIITETYILTSAACLEDLTRSRLYVVAGYKYYVNRTEFNTNNCTKNMRKRVVRTLVHKDYKFEYSSVTKWTKIDIAIAEVDSPFNFKDQNYIKYCSYFPTIIPVSLIKPNQKSGKFAFAAGWGNAKKLRKDGDPTDINKSEIHNIPLKIQKRAFCRLAYHIIPELVNIVTDHMICAKVDTNILSQIFHDDRMDEKKQLLRVETGTGKSLNSSRRITHKWKFELCQLNSSRRITHKWKFELCQNDHGNPLISFSATGDPVIIGVTSAFRVIEDGVCVGPYLFASTFRNYEFVSCIMNHSLNWCGRVNKKIMRRVINWSNYPDSSLEINNNSINNNLRSHEISLSDLYGV